MGVGEGQKVNTKRLRVNASSQAQKILGSPRVAAKDEAREVTKV